MDISLISISHKNAPLEVRARFAFPVEAQEELMRQAIARNIAEECVFISTCNREAKPLNICSMWQQDWIPW